MASFCWMSVIVALSATASTESRQDRPAAAKEARDAAEPAKEASVSCGWPNRGSLANAAELPLEGEGYVVPGPWRERGLQFGTDALVGLITRAASEVAREYPGSVVGIADLSRREGGVVPKHLSHQSGRDADLIYYALDKGGEPMEPDQHMAFYRPSGEAHYARSPEWERDIPERSFDAERNWALVKALLTDDEVEVIRIFASGRIERWLLEQARARGEDEELIERARKVLLRPGNASAHHDHMHVRIACAERDLDLGRCRRRSTRSPRRGRKWRGGQKCPRVEPEKAGPDSPEGR